MQLSVTSQFVSRLNGPLGLTSLVEMVQLRCGLNSHWGQRLFLIYIRIEDTPTGNCICSFDLQRAGRNPRLIYNSKVLKLLTATSCSWVTFFFFKEIITLDESYKNLIHFISTKKKKQKIVSISPIVIASLLYYVQGKCKKAWKTNFHCCSTHFNLMANHV